MAPLISVLIVSYNTSQLTQKSIASVYSSRGFDPNQIEIIVCDNHSSDGTVGDIKTRFPNVKVISNQSNPGFGVGNNMAAEKAQGQYLLLLNSDATLKPDTLKILYESIELDPSVTAVAPVLLYPNKDRQQSCGYFPTPGRVVAWMLGLDKLPLIKAFFPTPYHFYDLTQYDRPLRPDWLMGACVMLPRANFVQVNGFDPKTFMYTEEVELFMRLKQSFPGQPLLTPAASAIHLGSASTTAAHISRLLLELKSLIILYQKHYPGYVTMLKWVINLGVVLRILIFSLIPAKRARAKEYMTYFTTVR